MVPVLSMVVAAVAGQAAIAVADSVPRYNVEVGCRSVARASEKPNKDPQQCINEEHRLRDQLAAEWSQFSAADKARCVQSMGSAWRPTYTELITCLEISREVRKLPAQSSREKMGR
jgi:hypothetical protein